jgi:hypothetical protein
MGSSCPDRCIETVKKGKTRQGKTREESSTKFVSDLWYPISKF